MERIRLRALEPEDVELMYEIENDEKEWRHGDSVAPFSRQQLLDYAMNYDADPFRAGQLRLVVVNDKNESIGIADLYEISAKNRNAFIGIAIHPEFRGRGYGTASIRLIADYAFKILKLKNLAAKVITSNHKALAMFKSSGFSEIGVMKGWQLTAYGFEDIAVLTLGADH